MDLVTKQREERKERILDVARRLVAERGYDGVTMRDLADASLVSVPTLYNLFGGKNELLFAAVESYIVDLLGQAPQGAEAPEGLGLLVAVAEQMSFGTLSNAGYARALMGFFGAAADSGGLQEFLSNEVTNALVGALDGMRGKRQLVGWAEPQVLGEHLAGQLTMTIVEWARGHIVDEALTPALLYSTGIVVLGLARGKAAVEIEKMVRDNQQIVMDLRPAERPALRNAGGGS